MKIDKILRDIEKEGLMSMTITPEEIRHLLQGYSHILLTAHVNPDGDAIGSWLPCRTIWTAWANRSSRS